MRCPAHRSTDLVRGRELTRSESVPGRGVVHCCRDGPNISLLILYVHSCMSVCARLEPWRSSRACELSNRVDEQSEVEAPEHKRQASTLWLDLRCTNTNRRLDETARRWHANFTQRDVGRHTSLRRGWDVTAQETQRPRVCYVRYTTGCRPHKTRRRRRQTRRTEDNEPGTTKREQDETGERRLSTEGT